MSFEDDKEWQKGIKVFNIEDLDKPAEADDSYAQKLETDLDGKLILNPLIKDFGIEIEKKLLDEFIKDLMNGEDLEDFRELLKKWTKRREEMKE